MWGLQKLDQVYCVKFAYWEKPPNFVKPRTQSLLFLWYRTAECAVHVLLADSKHTLGHRVIRLRLKLTQLSVFPRGEPLNDDCAALRRLPNWLAGRQWGQKPASATSSICRGQKKVRHNKRCHMSWCMMWMRVGGRWSRVITHIRRHLSFPPLATLWPSGLQSTAKTWMTVKSLIKLE